MTTPSPPSPEKQAHASYLRSLLNKNLRVTTTDTRMFWGAFKCTDSVRPPSSLTSHPRNLSLLLTPKKGKQHNPPTHLRIPPPHPQPALLCRCRSSNVGW